MANLYRAAAGINRLEQLALGGDSPIHRLHPLAKLFTALIYAGTVISFPYRDVSGLAAFLLYPAVMMPLSGTPCRPLLVRLAAALPFSLMGGAGNLLVLRGAAFSLGGFTVTLGMVSFASIMLKTLLTVFAALILIATTSLAELNYQAARIGVPKILCLQFSMTYRYISVLIAEVAAMYTAYTLRGPEQGGIKMKDMGGFLGQLILRSFDRAERVYHAMKCRGFEGVYHGGSRRPFRRSDGLYVLGFTGIAVVLRLFNLSSFLGGFVSRGILKILSVL
jgi:cobalt/nickel transport system permease protein